MDAKISENVNVEKILQNEKDKLVFGTDKVLKLLKEKALKAVVYSQNTPENIVKELESLKSTVQIYSYGGSSTKLGTICGRPHTISVLGVKK